MALTDTFPGPNGLTDSIEAGKDLAGLVAHNVDGSPRAGILAKGPGDLVTGRTDLRVDIAPFKAALVRDGAVRLIANDSAAQSPAFTLPPANSRIDVLYVKVNEVLQGDASDGPVFGVLQGTAAPVPTRPTLNIDGALELATVRVSAGITNTAAVPIVQTAPVSGGARPARGTVEFVTEPNVSNSTTAPTALTGWVNDTSKTEGYDSVVVGVSGSQITLRPGTYQFTALATLNRSGLPLAVTGRSYLEVSLGEGLLVPKLRSGPPIGEDSWCVSGVRTITSNTAARVDLFASIQGGLAGSHIRLNITRVG